MGGVSKDFIILMGIVLLLPGSCSLSYGLRDGSGVFLFVGCLFFGVSILIFVWLLRGKAKR